MIRDKLTRTKRLLGLTVAGAVLFGLLVFVPVAFAEAPAWRLHSALVPSRLAPGSQGQIIVMLTDLGETKAIASEAEPVKLGVQLPPGLTATEMAVDTAQEGFGGVEMRPSCELTTLTCTAEAGTVYPYSTLMVILDVSAAANAQSGSVRLSASGGGAAPVVAVEPVSVGSEPVTFGVERLEEVPLNYNGSLDTQAGSHPFQFVTTLQLNSDFEKGENFLTEGPSQPALPKELRFNLPPGVVGNPSAVAQCPMSQFQPAANPKRPPECPLDTVVGVASVTLSLQGTPLGQLLAQPFDVVQPLYSLTPSRGEPARFGFSVATVQGPYVPVYLDTAVRTGSDYGVTVSVHNISQEVSFLASQVTFWGVPADSRHDTSRGECLGSYYRELGCSQPGQQEATPFLTLPTSCTGPSNPFTTNVEAASWQAPSVFTPASQGEYRLNDGAGHLFGMDGCNRLAFEPSITVTPDGQQASTPTGLTVGVHVPQQASLNPDGLADSTVKDTTVTLPAGMALNPAAADGLQSCSEAQVGLSDDAIPSCPEAAKVGTVEIKSPLLPNPLTGGVYLAAQNANPFGSLVALYIVARDAVSGTLIKVAGEVKLDPVTGQLVSTFDNTPQLPFEDLKLHFFGGDRAPLATPASCGSYAATASIAPWSEGAAVASSSTFEITSGPNGSACPGTLPFSPSLTAGTTSIQAGGFSPFTMTVGREDGQQNIGAIQLHLPEGLSGELAGVELCGEAQADTGTCGPNSLIGETTVSVGTGGDPYSVTGGKVYVTGPYEGAPFGLSVVVPAKAGPYDLGTVVVRGRIEVNPLTAALTVTTNSEAQGYAIPRILDGIPLQIRHVNFVTSRPNFTFNPTSCDPIGMTGSIASVEGSSSAMSVPFQVANCAALSFKPTFKVSTGAHTSRVDGASLTVAVVPPAEGPQNAISGSSGSSASAKPEEANIKSVKVELPKQLPSRLTTLQKACTAQQFNSNPAQCPSASMVGTATARTPILSNPLAGPAYFVSHGNEAFPQLIIVLQGENGVLVDLVGNTFISKAGITSSTFASVPDVPVSSFELTLSRGPHSALTANASLCAQPLSVPTEFTGQNGAVLKQDTPIEVEGCSNTISFTSHRIKGRRLTVSVYTPAAGKVSVGGDGLKSVTKTAKRRETITFKLTQKRAGKLKTTVKATFTPSAGKERRKQAKTLRVRFRK